jgi:hypothetical protein
MDNFGLFTQMDLCSQEQRSQWQAFCLPATVMGDTSAESDRKHSCTRPTDRPQPSMRGSGNSSDINQRKRARRRVPALMQQPTRLEFLAAQPWFDPSAEPWPCGGDELFVGLVTFELAGDGQRKAESRDVLLDFKAPLLASRTQSQFRLALRKARPRLAVGGKRSSSSAADDDRLWPHAHAHEGHQGVGAALFAHVATAGVALHGQLLHTQITRMTDNVQVLAGGSSHAISPMPFLRLQVSGPTQHTPRTEGRREEGQP